ncbi:MAG: hypothetical protein PHX68_02015 [Alphaproteobacteria bacterium]|nr:hypothetical protein [Alphaproteobacteria bacterium]
MRYIGLICGILMLARACLAGDIVAVVNDEPVSRLDVAAEAALLKLQDPDGAAPDAAEELIDSILKIQTAAEAGLSVTDDDVRKARAYLEEQNTGAGSLAQALRDAGVPERILEQRIRADLMWGEYVRRQNTRADVSAAEVDNRKRLLERIRPEAGRSVPVWELAQAVLPRGSRALAGAGGLPLADGCDGFVKRVSPEGVAGSVQRGMVAPERLPPELKRVLDPARTETIVGPLPAPNGQLFLMKCAVADKIPMPSDDEIRQRIMMERLGQLSDQLLKEARRRAVIERKG